MKNNFITKIIGATLAFAMMIGGAVGINAAKQAKEVFADDAVYYTLQPRTGSDNSYAGAEDIAIAPQEDDASETSITWNVTGNATLTPWRLGGKSISGTHRKVFSKTAMPSAITKVELEIGAASSITINSISLGVGATSSNFSEDTVTKTTPSANSTLTFEPTSGSSWDANRYYQFDFNLTVSVNSNKFVEFKTARFFYAEGVVETKTATATTVTAAGNKTTLDLAVSATDSVQLSAAVTPTEGSISNPTFLWASSNEEAATVDANGLVTAVAKGNTTITATYAGDDDYLASSGEIEISVIRSSEVIFDFATIASANSWVNGTAYTSVVVDGVTITANGGGNNGKYYTSDTTWRMYNGGSITITPPSGKSIASVTSDPSRTFVLASGGTSASLNVTATTNFLSIIVELADEKIVDTITASVTNTSRVWRTNDTVIASDLTVIPHFTDGTDGTAITDGAGVTVTNGTLQNVGNNTVNVSYGGKSTTVVVNALSSTVVEWTITGQIGETVKTQAYDLSGLTLHGWYDNEKTDEASSTVMSAYTLVANPTTAGDTPDENNTIEVKVYAVSDTEHENCLHTFANVPAPIANYPKGSVNNPYTVSEARNAIDTHGTMPNKYVEGIISRIDNFNNGAITYWISDDGTTTNQLEAYKGKKAGGVSFDAIGDIELGASVTITGTLKKYNDTTYEFDQNNELVSYSAPTNEWRINNYLNSSSSTFSINGSEHRSSTVDPESIVFGELGLSNDTQYATPFNGGHFTITFGGGANDGKYYTTGTGIRTYGGGTITIASTEPITNVEFTWSSDSYKPESDSVANPGTYDAETAIWTGAANSLVLTRPSGSGHWRLQAVTVSYGAFESVSNVKLRFGASVPVEKWNAINNLEDCEITDYGVMLYKTKAQYAESAPTVQARYAANHSYVAVFNKGSGVAPTAEDGKYTFTARIDYTDETEYSKYIIAQAFIVVNGTDYYFLGEEMRESVRSLAGKANVETNLSSDALTYLTTAGN